jgi:hypothetical protein
MTEKQRAARQSQKHADSKTAYGSGAASALGDNRLLATLAAVFLALVAFNLWGTLKPVDRGLMPEEVLGTWTTTDQDYVDRAFEIRSNSVVFYTGESSYTVHLIETVEVDDMDGPLLVTINYAQDGGLNTFSFYYEPADGGVITFKNQRDMKWKRRA